MPAAMLGGTQRQQGTSYITPVCPGKGGQRLNTATRSKAVGCFGTHFAQNVVSQTAGHVGRSPRQAPAMSHSANVMLKHFTTTLRLRRNPYCN